MRGFDFSSWQSVLATLAGLGLVTLIGVGVRLLMMATIQQRRERMNRQINERLRVLIAAYKALGGSFTGDLVVDPRHLRDLKRGQPVAGSGGVAEPGALDPTVEAGAASDRTRRIRDIVESALSDILLLGTEEHVRLAERAVRELVAGRPVHTHELVVSLRDFIREALDLDPIPRHLAIPMQGPARPSATGGGGKGERGKQQAKQGEAGDGGMGPGGGVGLGASVDEPSSPGHHS
ncbi:MAG TPA: hypothetical protein VGC51_05270 [Hansschlegelia sp.]